MHDHDPAEEYNKGWTEGYYEGWKNAYRNAAKQLQDLHATAELTTGRTIPKVPQDG